MLKGPRPLQLSRWEHPKALKILLIDGAAGLSLATGKALKKEGPGQGGSMKATRSKVKRKLKWMVRLV